MTTSVRHNNVAFKFIELSLAVPQVLSQRLILFALAGPVLQRRERKELFLMIAEKQLAFTQSWVDINAEMLRLQQELMLSMFTGRLPSPVDALQSIALKGITPIHRRATRNSKRLARRRYA